MVHFNNSKGLIKILLILCCFGSLLALDSSKIGNAKEGKVGATIEWDPNVANFPLTRVIQLNYLNKIIHPKSIKQIASGLLEIYADEGIFVYDSQDLLPVEISSKPSESPVFTTIGKDDIRYTSTADNYLIKQDQGQITKIRLPVDSLSHIVAITTVKEKVIIGISDGTIGWMKTDDLTFHQLNIPNAIEIYDMIEDDQDRIWVATDAGIFLYKGDTRVPILLKRFDQTSSIPDNLTISMTYDGESTISVGTYESGIFTINTNTLIVEKKLPNIKGQINYLVALNSTKIIANILFDGIYLIDLNSSTRQLLHKMPNGKNINGICVIDEGWIAVITEDSELILINPVFQKIDLGITELQCVQQNGDGLMIGTAHGLYKYENGNLITLINGTEHLNIVSLFSDENKNLWIGTYGQGLFKLNKNYKLERIDVNYSIDKNIMSIAGYKNNIYLATLAGAFSITLDPDNQTSIKNVKNYQKLGSIGAQFIYSVIVDEDGKVWFGSDGKGLWSLQNDQLIPYSDHKEISNRSVQSISSFNNQLWVNLDGEELINLTADNPKKLNKFSYSANNISGIVEVGEHWSAAYSDGKILLLNKENSGVILHDKLFEDETFIPTLNSAATTNDGSAVICADKYLIQISNTYLIKRILPKTVIHSVQSNPDNKEGLQHNFKSDENTIDINYSGIWFNDPSKISFRYILKNYEKQWNTTLNKHVFYTRLPPGDFIFNIETVYEQGNTSRKPLQYAFNISKPFYATWWFRVSVAIAVISGFYFFIISLERSRKRKQKLESDKLEAQINILKSQINPHFLFNSFNTLTALIDEDPKNASLYVEKLSGFYRALLTLKNDVHTVAEELNILNDFYFLLKQRFGDNLDLVVDVPDRTSLIPPLTFQLLFENVINHNVISITKPMKVTIIQNEDLSILFSNDKQIKSSNSSGAGIGLQNIKNRYRLMFNKDIKIDEEGEVFSVMLPFVDK